MSQFDEALRLFEELDGLNDAFIEEGMLPDASAAPARRTRERGNNPFLRFANSGWGVAIICAVVSLGVLTAIVRLGVRSGNQAGDGIPPNAPDNHAPAGTGEQEVPTEAVTEEAVTLPDEGDRVPAGKTSTDEEGLRYKSYGNGTCVLVRGQLHRQYEALHIPNYSPDGDVVVAIDAYAFRNQADLREVTLPAGLRELDHKAFPMDAPIYNLYGNILYLGSSANPYMVAVATADNRPGATALHPNTRILACHALTYDTGSYFAMAWADQLPAYKDDEVFSIPSGIIHIGEYALLDVGRDITYNGYLVGWDTLTAGEGKDLGRTVDGHPLTVHCLDGTAKTRAYETRTVRLSGGNFLENGVFVGPYGTDIRMTNEEYNDWLKNPDAFERAPEQFVVGNAYGNQPHVLTAEELAMVRFERVDDEAYEYLDAFIQAYNKDPSELYAGKSVVMLYVTSEALWEHVITDIDIGDGHIHITLARVHDMVGQAEGKRFILIPVDDPDGSLQNATVTYEIAEEWVTLPENES